VSEPQLHIFLAFTVNMDKVNARTTCFTHTDSPWYSLNMTVSNKYQYASECDRVI